MSDFRPPERIKNALDNVKLNLSAKCPADPSKWSSLIWGIHANNARLTVWTNDPNDTGESKGYGKIVANIDLPMFFMFTTKLDEVANHVGEVKYTFQIKGYTFFGGKRSDSQVVMSELWVGKDKDGLVWMSLTMRDRPRIKFVFGLSLFGCLLKGDGTPLTDSEISVMDAKGRCKILENMIPTLAVNNYVPPVKKENKGNFKQAASSSSGDGDIPF
jgi:hypothetical protein